MRDILSILGLVNKYSKKKSATKFDFDDPICYSFKYFKKFYAMLKKFSKQCTSMEYIHFMVTSRLLSDCTFSAETALSIVQFIVAQCIPHSY